MSAFLQVAKEHKEELERIMNPTADGRLSYSDASTRGLLKQISVSLPVDVISKLEVIQESGLWSSKQEVVYDIITCAVDDFYSFSSDDLKRVLDHAGHSALQSLDISDKARSIYQTSIPDDVRASMSEDDFVASFLKAE